MRAKAKMNKLAYVITAVTLTIFAAMPTFAEAAKFAANVVDMKLVGAANTSAKDWTTAAQDWVTVSSISLHTANKSDLVIGASLETGILTRTEVKGKKGNTDTSSAAAELRVRLLINGVANHPDLNPQWVTFDKRVQTLSATLGGVIQSCQDRDLDNVINVGDECVVDDEEIELFLETMGARHFNFIWRDSPSGTHTITVQVKVDTSTDATNGTAEAMATLGRGSFIVEEVKATNSPNGIEF
jgi:hypothetical protein